MGWAKAHCFAQVALATMLALLVGHDVSAQAVPAYLQESIERGKKQVALNALDLRAIGLVRSFDYAGAAELLLEAVELSKGFLGQDAPQTLLLMDDYADALGRSGQRQEAEAVLTQIHLLRRGKLGEKHAETLASLTRLAHGRAEEAKSLSAEAVRAARAFYGDTHPALLDIISNHASLLLKLGQKDDAEILYAEALQKRQAIFGHVPMRGVASVWPPCFRCGTGLVMRPELPRA